MTFKKLIVGSFSSIYAKAFTRMSSAFDIQPIGRFVGQSAAIKRPKVCSVQYAFMFEFFGL
jgi:hypothetical protein